MIALITLLVAAMAQPSDYDDPLFLQLAQREAVSCEQVFEGRDLVHTRDSLLRFSREHRSTPYVPMRSVACLVSQLPEDPVVHQAARGWIQDTASPGYALVVARHLDRMPLEPALDLSRELLRRADQEPRLQLHLLPTLAASTHARVRALVAAEP